ncbi:MAG: hypothetical protein SPL99_10460 [Catonella sp.]|nr:hypothetical protein [Catonella sp.]MDY6356207.1 hypothetical protein [Catonella sp.]
MLYEYLDRNFKNGEPILLSEFPEWASREDINKLIKDGRLKRYSNGIYYKSYNTSLGIPGTINSYDIFIKKYLKPNGVVSGYYTGLRLYNGFGFTTQNPAWYEICTNSATTPTRKVKIRNLKVILYKPVAPITEKNVGALQFLDLMRDINIYCELDDADRNWAIKRYIDIQKPDINEIRKYLPLYPLRIYKNLYEGGILGELAQG